jgi:hypothetical protein
MEVDLMANDNTLHRNRLLALATLLKEALPIEHDLAGRLVQQPKQKSLLKQHKEYQRLIGRLCWELERALATYLTRLRAANGADAREAAGRSGCASGAPRPAIRRTRIR